MKYTLKHSVIAAALALSFGHVMGQEVAAMGGVMTDPPLTTGVVETAAPGATVPGVTAEAAGAQATGAQAAGAEGGGNRRNTSSSSSSASSGQSASSSVAMEWTGGGRLDAEGSANASTTQTTTNNVSSNTLRSPNRAIIESGAVNGASGNIGLNMAAGTGNLQGNATAIASIQEKDVFSSATTYANQTTMTNFSFNVDDSANEATMDAALAGASGNIGVNLASGSGNTQSNQLAMVESGGSKVSRAAVSIDQSASGNQSQSASSYESTNSANTARMMSGALAQASGNIGVSIAAGVGNAQANAMSVSVVR